MTHDMGEYDAYNYWDDVEYLSDGHYDAADSRDKEVPSTAQPAAVSSQELTHPQWSSRKRKAADVAMPSRDTRKKKKLATELAAVAKQNHGVSGNPLTGSTAGRPVVIWRAHAEINNLDYVHFPELKSACYKRNLTPVALLKDWRLRFSDAVGFSNPCAKDDGFEMGAEQVPSCENEGDDDAVEDNEEPKDGVDVTDLKAVAGALTEESMEALRAMLTTKGIPIEALDVVLKDMLEGRNMEGSSEDEQEPREPQEQEAVSRNAEQGLESMIGQHRRRPKHNNVAVKGGRTEPIVEVQEAVLTESSPVVSRKKRRRF